MSRFYDPTDVMRVNALEALDDDAKGSIAVIKDEGQAFWDILDGLPQSAEMTLAKRKLEEAVMWAVKAVTA